MLKSMDSADAETLWSNSIKHADAQQVTQQVTLSKSLSEGHIGPEISSSLANSESHWDEGSCASMIRPPRCNLPPEQLRMNAMCSRPLGSQAAEVCDRKIARSIVAPRLSTDVTHVCSKQSRGQQNPCFAEPDVLAVARPPSQFRMDGQHAAPELSRSGTRIVETFQEARYWFPFMDSIHGAVCDCCCATKYHVSEKGLKIVTTRPCAENINNVDWPAIDDVDYHTDCCYGYVELATGDNELGDVTLRVHKGEAESISQKLLNLSTGRGPHASDNIVRSFKEACICMDPSSVFTQYIIAQSSLKIRRKGCLPCTGVSVNSIRWINRQGDGNVLDIDMKEDCCFGYIDVSTSDAKFGDQTLRVSKGSVDSIVQELRNLNIGLAA